MHLYYKIDQNCRTSVKNVQHLARLFLLKQKATLITLLKRNVSEKSLNLPCYSVCCYALRKALRKYS